jgi:hypothetical protein
VAIVVEYRRRRRASCAFGRIGLVRARPRISGASCAKIHADAAVMIPTQTKVA